MKNLWFKNLILFEDTDFLAITKPPGISTLEDRAETTHMLSIAKDHHSNIQVCHRIDKDTSGVLVFAKHEDAYRHLSLQFQNREVAKTYHAIVHGQTNFEDTRMDVPLTIKNQGIVKWDRKSGKESVTFFNTLQNFKSFSLLECKPVTGRRHQIRIHLKFLQHSIVGDKMYDGSMVFLSQIKRKYKHAKDEEKPLIARMALHAKNINFKKMNEDPIQIEAPYPKDFLVLLKQLQQFDVN